MRIVLSIGPTEAMHFQTWQDKAGNAPPLTASNLFLGQSKEFFAFLRDLVEDADDTGIQNQSSWLRSRLSLVASE
jgi:hypothetical protein